MFSELRLLIKIAIYIGGSLVLGLLIDNVLVKRWVEYFAKTQKRIQEILFSSLRYWVVLWTVLIGTNLLLRTLELSEVSYGYIKTISTILTIASISLVVARVVGKLIDLSTEKVRGAVPKVSLLSTLAKLLVLFLGILVILNSIGVSITPILASLGIGGLAVALALQDTLTNVIAGLHIILSRNIKVGDYVVLETGEEGFVADISWRNTEIRELSNNLIIVPNSKVSSSIVKNYNLPEAELSVLVQIGVSYDSDLKKVERVTIEVAREVLREVSGGVPEFDPLIRFHTFSEYSIKFSVILRAKQYTDNFLLKHEFIKRLHERYKEEGIVIPYPIRTVYLSESSGVWARKKEEGT
ncbi:MAG TPA: mechanosensitive ion channel family protein [Candidatus Hydrothermia bacterium]|nr:mechanosensitive ion channel family protein [Candidatus Hydrothermae bacterium]MDD3648650.1 mechanosensitive ion channel family protein [Candidatus Hydrothermia bacterium]MDD5572230.1 mechanosensitive ion channel family protein [Candidatus Hydrothermia bacterium]HOK22490.1 mechanosensitive ion channel family protein [Candidatus Hydrothermia bacterium]HOP32617.1 mechanosensitive ion channel family protein [Candidatus Hydrothermia bacterium]